MKVKMLNSNRTGLVLAAVLVLLGGAPLVAGGGSKEKAPTNTSGTGQAIMVWPMPPEKPRVRFLEMFSNNYDIEPRKKLSLVDRMVGNTDPNKVESFQRASSAASDSKGRILITSAQNGTLYVLDKDRHQIMRIKGDRGIMFKTPLGLAVDSHDNIYVADPQLHMVMKFDSNGHLLATIGQNPTLQNPTLLALDEARRRIFVVDSHLHQVLVYNLDTLQTIATVGKRGTKNGEFNYPVGVGVNRAGYFAVTDTGSCSVEVFSPDFKFVRRFGGHGDRPGFFTRPKGVAFDSEGNIWVVDAAFNNVQIFDPKGTVLMFVGNFGKTPGAFNLPLGINIDAQDRVYVGDALNSRVQVFKFLGGDHPGSPRNP
jgi:DNA-binding beta-propeller fold protein YncE